VLHPAGGDSAGPASGALCEWLRAGPPEPFYVSAGFTEVHIEFRTGPTSPERLARTQPLPWLPDHPALRQDLADLSHSIAAADRAVARITETLDATGLSERTLLVFTSDHGLPLARAKATLYDPGIRTALLMHLPGVLAAGRVVSELASNVDFAPTVLELCGVPVPDSIQGRGLSGLLCGGDYRPRAEVFAELTYHETYNPMRAIRTHRHKLIRNFEPRPRTAMPVDYWSRCASAPVMRPWLEATPPEWELYDLATDPWEQRNLADRPAYAATLASLAERLAAWMRETDDPLLKGPVPAP
jgi:arylsulfatase A-like enzyme